MPTVDACLAVKLALPEPDSHLARVLWQQWTDGREELVAPPFFRAEVLSTIRRWVHFGYLSAADGEEAYAAFNGLTVQLRDPTDLYAQSWQLARRFNQPTVYDCCYLALAVITGTEFWTADERFARAVHSDFPQVRLLSEFAPS